jgi:cell division protein FtsB
VKAASTLRSLPLPLVRLTIVACVPLAALFVVSFARIAIDDYQLHQQKWALERRVEGLKQENSRLKQRIDYLSSDAGLELLAREELGWVKSGDTAVVVIQDASANGNATTGRSVSLTIAPPSR